MYNKLSCISNPLQIYFCRLRKSWVIFPGLQTERKKCWHCFMALKVTLPYHPRFFSSISLQNFNLIAAMAWQQVTKTDTWRARKGCKKRMAIFAILLLSFIFHDAIKNPPHCFSHTHLMWRLPFSGIGEIKVWCCHNTEQSSTFIHNYNVLAVSDLIPSSQALSRPWLAPGLVTNSIRFCRLSFQN